MQKECVKMKMFRYLKGNVGIMCFGFFIKVIGTVMDLIIPLILAYIIDEVTEVDKIIVLGIVMILCSIIAMLFNAIANRFAALTARRFTRKMRHDLFVKINSLSMEQVDTLTQSSVMSRMSTDTYNVHQMIMIMQRMGVRAPILLVGGICMTLFLDPILTLVLVAMLPLITFIIFFFTFKGFPLFSKVQRKIDDLVRTMRENITGTRVIKALSKKEYEEQRFDIVNKAVMESDLKAGKNMAKVNPFINLFLNIGLVLVIFFGAYRVNNGVIKSGVIISFTTYFTIILNAMVSMTRIFMIYSKALASSKRIDEVFALEPTLLKEEKYEDDKSDYFVEFRNVNFAYRNQKNVLENINFKLKQGESLGIIGATGSGKSTIINLIMRYYDCDGSVYIDGKNIKSYDLLELREYFGVSFQNDAILNDTIKNNIVFGREYNEELFKEVCDIARVTEFCSYEEADTRESTARGTNLSGGQKQRILIARSLYGSPKILILDDSTSALDYKTDSLIRKDIKDKFPNITLIYVSSRVSSIASFSNIIVLENGRIYESGTHNELIENKDGIYKEIYNIQMGGEVYE